MSFPGPQNKICKTDTPVPTHRLSRKTTFCPAPLQLQADLHGDRSSKIGSVRNLFEALRRGTVNELLGVRRCTVWNVAVTCAWKCRGVLKLPPLACRLERQSQHMPGCLDWEVHLHLRDGCDVVHTLMDVLTYNRTIEVFRLHAAFFEDRHWRALIDCLEHNMCLRHLTVNLTMYMPNMCSPYVRCWWKDMNEKISQQILRTGRLQTLQVNYRKPWDDPNPKDVFIMTSAHKCVVAVAIQLSQVCRLDTSAGTRQGFKSAVFRWRLLLHFLCPTLNKKMTEGTLQTGSLHTLHLKHMCWDELRATAPQGGPLHEALRANRFVGAVDKHLSQICRLSLRQSTGFNSPMLRWWILSQFLSPNMSPDRWQTRILGEPVRSQACGLWPFPALPLLHMDDTSFNCMDRNWYWTDYFFDHFPEGTDIDIAEPCLQQSSSDSDEAS